MNVELLVIPGCPGADDASSLLRGALDDIGHDGTPFTVVTVDPVTARTREFAGSPAFVVDGVDLFAGGGSGGSMACRLYPTPEGPRNVPTRRDLRAALTAHVAGAARP